MLLQLKSNFIYASKRKHTPTRKDTHAHPPTHTYFNPIQYLPCTIDVIKSSLYFPGITYQSPTTSNFLKCEVCRGHGVWQPGNPTFDPRCRYGCNRNMTYPPPTSENTEEPHTDFSTTELPPEGPTSDPTQLYAWGEQDESGSPIYNPTQSPMMKLIPKINEKMVPLLTREQHEQYENIIRMIRILKAKETHTSR